MQGTLIKVGETSFREKTDDRDNLEAIPQTLHNHNQSENYTHLAVIRKNERPGLLGLIKPSKTQIKQEDLALHMDG